MNETSNPPRPVPGHERITVPGELPTANPVPAAAPGQPAQVLGADPTRVVADFSGPHLRSSEASLREILARISKSSGAVPNCAFALGTAK